MTASGFTESTLKPQLSNLMFTQLVLFMEGLAEEIRFHGGQGASDEQWTDAQAMCVFEEAGEFAGSWRRFRGFARRQGDMEDVTKELADVIISAFVMFAVLGEDAEVHIKAKLREIVTRGYVNKGED